MKRLAIALGMAVLVCTMPTLSHATTFSFQTVINPGDAAFTQLLGINNASTVAGYFGDGTVVPNNGFTTVPPYNTFTPENFPGAVQTQVVGINNTGETVGFYIDAAGNQHGFTFDGTTFKSHDDPNGIGTVTQFLGVNDSGETAGYWTDGAGIFHPFTWVPGTFSEITTIPGQVSAQATDVNNAGDVTGFNLTSGGTLSDGFLIDDGTVTKLDFPGSTFTQALGLNDKEQVVGFYTDALGVNHGFIYDITTNTYRSIDDPNAVGPGGTIINGINDKGQVVGFYVDANGNTDGLVGTPTPEPASLLLIGTGLIALHRKLRKQAA